MRTLETTEADRVQHVREQMARAEQAVTDRQFRRAVRHLLLAGIELLALPEGEARGQLPQPMNRRGLRLEESSDPSEGTTPPTQ